MGPCEDGLPPTACQIWDFRRTKADTNAWGAPIVGTWTTATPAYPTGADVFRHFWGTATDAVTCADRFPGAAWNSTDDRCESAALLDAVEVAGDMVGNENYLCESDEICVYSPYPGAFQGDGALVPAAGFDFVDGAVSGVVLYEWSNQGVLGAVHTP